MNSKDFIAEITEHLTGEQAKVVVNEDESGAVITVTPAGNVSSLIGKGGTTIDAIRVLCKAIGYNGKHRVKVKIDEKNRHSNWN